VANKELHGQMPAKGLIMRKIRYFTVDVFTDERFGGNPLAVFPDASTLNDKEMQQLARELNLSETVFVLPPVADEAVKKLRIFTPGKELPLAGHPVVGTWFLLASQGLIDLEKEIAAGKIIKETLSDGLEKLTLMQELAAGVLPVMLIRSEGKISSVIMQQAAAEIGDEIKDVEQIAAAIGLKKYAITASMVFPRVVSTGIPVLIVPLGGQADLDKITLSMEPFRQVVEELDVNGIYAYTRDMSSGSEAAFVSARGFYPTLGVWEDAATGSAAGSLGAFLSHNRILRPKGDSSAFLIEQGVAMGRSSQISVEVTKKGEQIDKVRVGGSAVLMSQGEFLLP
jgi:trans-2,3-dihydro-3-hydroxyanthranilate isomerase